MKTAEEIIKMADKMAKKPFVTEKFGNSWKQGAKENYDIDSIIEIAHYQGRRAILLERSIKELIESREQYAKQEAIEFLKFVDKKSIADSRYNLPDNRDEPPLYLYSYEKMYEKFKENKEVKK